MVFLCNLSYALVISCSGSTEIITRYDLDKIQYALVASCSGSTEIITRYDLDKIQYALVAQLVEQLPFKEMVVGSIPTEGTKSKAPVRVLLILCPRAKYLRTLRVGIENLFRVSVLTNGKGVLNL